MSELGYVVVEFNQASGRPELSAFPCLIDDREEAEYRRDLLTKENRSVGRRERYAIATLILDEDEE